MNASPIDIIRRVTAAEDTDRAQVAAATMNAFMLALNKLGGRNALRADDVQRLGQILALVDGIPSSSASLPRVGSEI